MVKTTEELDEIFDIIYKKVLTANRMDELDNLLISWSINLDEDNPYGQKTRYKTGKIVVIGESQIKENHLRIIVEELGLNIDRFEFSLGYEKAQKYNYQKLMYQQEYSLILFGPVPHSTKYKGNSSSIITELEANPCYPPVMRLMDGNDLKITKNSFKNALLEAIKLEKI